MEIARLEFGGIAGQCLKVANTLITSAGFKQVVKGEGGEHGITAGTAATNHDALGVGEALVDQVLSTGDHIIDIFNAPGTVEGLSIGSAITRTAAIIHVEHSKTSVGPELYFQIEPGRGGTRWPAVAHDS